MADTKLFTLAAGEKRSFPSGGGANYLYINNATGLLTVEFLKRNTSVEPPHAAAQQFNFKNRSFDRFEVVNISGASNDIRIFSGPGDYDPPADRATVTVDDTDPVSVTIASGTVTLNQSTISNGGSDLPDLPIAATTTVIVIPTSASNVRARITNLSANTDEIRVGTHPNIDAVTGTPLQPGETWESDTSAAVYVYNSKASAQSVAREVETRT